MLHWLQTFPDTLIFAGFTLGSIVATKIVISTLSKNRKFDEIPTIGSISWLGSLWSGGRFHKDIQALIQEGYEKYKSTPFKIADRYRWVVVLGSRQHIDELRNAPSDKLSFLDAVNEGIQFEYTLGIEIRRNPYHFNIIRSQLTRGLENLYPDIQDEISTAFDEILDLEGNEWKTVPAMTTIQKVSSRASNRIFVGLPLCRDDDWTDLSLQFTRNVVKKGTIIRLFPSFLFPIISYFIPDVANSKKHALNHLAPLIQQRLKTLEECGDNQDGKPNDLISWLIDEAPEGKERTAELWTSRVLAVIFSAVHPVGNTFSNALFFLAENPQYIKPLREEVEAVVGRGGWSKASLAKMYKIDSFLKESQRLFALGAVGLQRLALEDITFSDGTFVPKGTVVAVASRSRQLDEEHYENAHKFDPFRFSDMRIRDPDSTRFDFVSTSAEYLLFGHGKHACSGRFFAALVLKCMLAHLVLSYDVKLAGMAQSKVVAYGTRSYIDPAVKVMFRRRAN